MDAINFQGTRWMIVCGNYDGIEKYAVNELYKIVQQYVPYILIVNRDDIESNCLKYYNVIFIGTNNSNKYIVEFIKDGILKPNDKKQGYAIKVCKSSINPEKDMVIISGHDVNGTLYAVRDFEHYYSDPSKYLGHHYYHLHKPFIDKMPEYETSSAPVVENRGLWTWGHVIYDYKAFLDNMSKWKMNIITIWNDYAPLNARDIVEYAHSRGIKVIWGYSWCWGEKVNPVDQDELDKWTDRIICTYEQQYAHLDVDGIYFQTFTETEDTTLDGAPIAELVTNWVNYISSRLLEKYPDLWIQFGLHATSVKDECNTVAKIDPRINITWEDAGSFPYYCDAKQIDKFSETLELTSKICGLRGSNDDFGIVVKGLTMLNWPTFEHQKGVFILGEASEEFKNKRAEHMKFFWRYSQAYCTQNLNYVLAIFRVISKKKLKRLSIVALVEDGMWEEKRWYPVALYAESLWNPEENAEEIIRKVSLTGDAFFA